jgi:hypothetical protein
LEARQLGGTTLYIQFQVEQNKINFYFVPDDPQDISISYTSRGWVRLDSDPTKREDYVTADGDTILFDPLLVQKMLRLKWRANKGFDTQSQYQEFQSFLDTVRSKDIPAPDLSLSRQAGYPYLGYYNMPDTGFGRSS